MHTKVQHTVTVRMPARSPWLESLPPFPPLLCELLHAGFPALQMNEERAAEPLPVPLSARPPPQENRVVRLIRKQLVKRSIDMVSEIAGREDKKVRRRPGS